MDHQEGNIPPVIPRQWTTWSQLPAAFSVMSYNLLAPVWAHPNNYAYMSATKVSWNWRRRLILAEIGHHRPDLVCMQVRHLRQLSINRVRILCLGSGRCNFSITAARWDENSWL